MVESSLGVEEDDDGDKENIDPLDEKKMGLCVMYVKAQTVIHQTQSCSATVAT